MEKKKKKKALHSFFIVSSVKKKEASSFFVSYLPIQGFMFTCTLVFLKLSQETQIEILL